MKGIQRERERERERERQMDIKERNVKNETERKKYQVRDTWTHCHVTTY